MQPALTNGTTMSDENKVLMLLNLLGEEGEKHVQNHPTVRTQLASATPQLSAVKKTASEVFGKHKNCIAACHEFFQSCRGLHSYSA